MITTHHGAILAVEPSTLETYATILKESGTWNPHVLGVCRRFLGDGGVFYDIGANVGYMSIEISKIFRDRVNVIAFEPQPSLARIIAVSAALNSFNNISVYGAMVGSETGHDLLFVPSHSVHASAVPRETRATCLRCPKTSIDHFVSSSMCPPPNIMKIDVEGGELDVIQGALNTIQHYRPYIIFESDENQHRFGYETKDIIRLISNSAQYKFFSIGMNKIIPIGNEFKKQLSADILAIPN